MPWHKVVIRHDDQARWSAAALMRPFIMGYHEHGWHWFRLLQINPGSAFKQLFVSRISTFHRF